MGELDKQTKVLGGTLLVSLAINIFLIGFFVARTFSGPSADSNFIPIDLDLRSLPLEFPAEVSERIEDAFRMRRHEIEGAYEDYVDTQTEILILLSEEDINLQALAAAFSTLRSLNIAVQGPIQDAMLDAVSGMDVELRRNLIRIQRPLQRIKLGQPRRFDGTRWSYELQDGNLVLDFTAFFGDEDEEPDESDGN